MYRQTLASILAMNRPHLEVRIATPEDLDEEVGSFEPHLVVCNVVTPLVEAKAIAWIQILFENGLDAIVSLDGQPSEVHDISTEDLLVTVDEIEKMVS